MTDLSPDTLAAIKARADAATPPPWVRRGQCIDGGGNGYDEVLTPGPVECMAYCYGGTSVVEMSEADAEFIAAARTDVPALLAAYEAVTAERDTLKVRSCDVAPYAQGDGDMRCQDCGHANPIWRAPNALWNMVMGGPDATDDPGGVVCPPCFVRRAEAAGVDEFWIFGTESALNRDGAEFVRVKEERDTLKATLDKVVAVIRDLDRCAHGRHEQDPCFDCQFNGYVNNAGNIFGGRIGTTLGGHSAITVRDLREAAGIEI